ncbi:hypothetical protein CC80DRAFT_223578 [Byssothecium circinans]|uniref:Uncharacterized protein n=1 Tax=Byssothecium circinans TaxID=147558 RepID=A0A6A5T9G6_9PLEO|nr:hypothetical protein CC80DRAFT_294915 [Byssothecium circinans]KAF1950845.1 hypothetical protein CC80DRAFT_223578 [Byssothecium circinans]
MYMCTMKLLPLFDRPSPAVAFELCVCGAEALVWVLRLQGCIVEQLIVQLLCRDESTVFIIPFDSRLCLPDLLLFHRLKSASSPQYLLFFSPTHCFKLHVNIN